MKQVVTLLTLWSKCTLKSLPGPLSKMTENSFPYNTKCSTSQARQDNHTTHTFKFNTVLILYTSFNTLIKFHNLVSALQMQLVPTKGFVHFPVIPAYFEVYLAIWTRHPQPHYFFPQCGHISSQLRYIPHVKYTHGQEGILCFVVHSNLYYSNVVTFD